MARPRRTAVIEEQQTATAAPAAQGSPEEEGLWAIAMLRIAMELKRPGAPGLQEIIDGVAARMGIARADLDRFLREQVGQLEEEAERRGYTR